MLRLCRVRDLCYFKVVARLGWILQLMFYVIFPNDGPQKSLSRFSRTSKQSMILN